MDKPVIQYIWEQLVEAGIQDIIIVSGYWQGPIEDHLICPARNCCKPARRWSLNHAHFIKENARSGRYGQLCLCSSKGPYGTAFTPIKNAAHLIGKRAVYLHPLLMTLIGEPNMVSANDNRPTRFMAAPSSCIRVTSDLDFERYGVCWGQKITKTYC